jgi:hypothetical protein
MPSEQWINRRCGLDISISRLVVDETAINNQAIEAVSAALRPCRLPAAALHCGRVVYRPSIGEATDNGDAFGLPGSPSRPRSIQDKVLMPISETA